MKAMIAALSVSLFAAACGDLVDNSACDLTALSLKVGSWPNDEARAKATEHLNKAKDSRAKKDSAACNMHMQEAEAALKL